MVKVILVGLSINFSLFITPAVIDLSNVMAHVFYNKIDDKASVNVQTLGNDKSSLENASSLAGFLTEFVGEDSRSIFLAIAGNVNPQSIITRNASKGFFENIIIITAAGLVNVLSHK